MLNNVILFYFQKRPEYIFDQPEKRCTFGCNRLYRTSRFNHWFLYHMTKTEALVCNCGWGTINEYRMRKHLQNIHGETWSVTDIIQNLYYFQIREFCQVNTCDQKLANGKKCEFRSPFTTIFAKHKCTSANQRYQMPETACFIAFLRVSERPIRGFPVGRQIRTPPRLMPQWAAEFREKSEEEKREAELMEEAKKSIPYLQNYPPLPEPARRQRSSDRKVFRDKDEREHSRARRGRGSGEARQSQVGMFQMSQAVRERERESWRKTDDDK